MTGAGTYGEMKSNRNNRNRLILPEVNAVKGKVGSNKIRKESNRVQNNRTKVFYSINANFF